MAEKSNGDDGIELEKDMGFQRGEWRAERVGWVLMLLVIAAAAVGLTGRGGLSQETIGEDGSVVRVEHETIGRHQGPTELKLAIAPGAGEGDRVEVRLNREFVENIEIERIDPEPESVTGAGGHYRYEFRRAPADSLLVKFFYEPATIGTLPLTIAVTGASEIRTHELYLP